MKNAIVYLLLIAQLLTSGCHSYVEIPPSQLVNQASFSSPEGKQTFVVKKKDGKSAQEFSSLKVEKGQLIGQLKNVKGVDETAIPISNVQGVEKKEFSPAKTTFAVIGGLAAVLAIFVGVAVAMLASSDGNFD